jgi:phage/plasmid primase-like uncharacterized protein
MTRAIPIEAEIVRRGIRLAGRGAERCGPCPVCGGHDRFSINLKKEVWNCRGCGRGGDTIDLIRHLDGVDFATACKTLGQDAVKAKISTGPVETKLPAAETQGLALRLWNEAVPIMGTLAERYLQHRGLELLSCDDVLRFLARCPFGGVSHPCMLGLYRDLQTDEPKAIHRTALGPGGVKIDRKALGPVSGCALKLDADENVETGLTIAEGIETALAGRQLGFRPAWAVGSAVAIKNFPVLGGIEALTILVDHDEADRNGRRAGQEAALACSERWTAAGREVQRVVPRRAGADMADLIGALS